MLHIVIGPPCSGKSTYVRENAKEGDVRVDFDLIAQALGSSVAHGSTGAIKQAAFKARTAVINWLLKSGDDTEAWIIHSSPADWQLEQYRQAGAELIELDADLETCLERAKLDERPDGEEDAIREWFANHQKGNSMQRIKTAQLSVKSAGENGGSVAGYAATFDRIPDSYGDVIAEGAFTKTLEEWAERNEKGIFIPLLYGHNMDDPAYNIGRVVKATQDEHGLYIEAEFDAESETAQQVRKLVQEGRLYQFSFAFAIHDAGETELEDGTKAYELRELELFEVSLVQIPANPRAEVTGIKAGRVLSKTNEDDIKAAVELLTGVLDRLGSDDEPKSSTDTSTGEGDPTGKSVGKGALVAERIKTYID